MTQRTQLVLAAIAIVIFSLLAVAAACGPNRDAPNRTGDPLILHSLGRPVGVARP